MKFGKELDQTAVPEWRGKYLDYKQAKKKLKALARALRTVDRNTPSSAQNYHSGTFNGSASFRQQQLRRSLSGNNVFSSGRDVGGNNAGGGTGGPGTPWSSVRDGPVYSFLNPPPGARIQAAGADEAEDPGKRGGGRRSGGSPIIDVDKTRASPIAEARRRSQGAADQLAASAPTTEQSPLRPVDERSPLRLYEQQSLQLPAAMGVEDDEKPRMTRYGSIIGSPPSGTSPIFNEALERQASLLELPDPALDPQKAQKDGGEIAQQADDAQPGNQGNQDTKGQGDDDADYDRPVSPSSPTVQARPPPPTQLVHQGSAYEIRQPIDRPTAPPSSTRRHFSLHQSLFSSKQKKAVATPQRFYSNPDAARPAFVKQIAPFAGPSRLTTFGDSGPSDFALDAYREVEFRQAEFFLYLENSLDTIERFYLEKEDDARDRLSRLREQLHIMRNQRVLEVNLAERRQRLHQSQQHGRSNGHASHASRLNDPNADGGDRSQASGSSPPDGANNVDHRPSITNRLKNSVVSQIVSSAISKVRPGHIGKTSKAMRDLGTPTLRPDIFTNPNNNTAAQRDHERHRPAMVSYRVAKRRLKIAMVEYYRVLELLKSYALLNRKAFQKINKKYDKTVNARPKLRFMTEKVNTAHFTNSDNVDGFIQDVEDLYARYFERGNHKLAVSKLRAKGPKAGQYSGNMFRTGSLGAAGIVLAILGLIRGVSSDLNNPDAHLRSLASLLLQLYAGYFLLLLVVIIFCIDARAFDETKISYKFVFEFDTRTALDWRQLSEMPALFGFFLGLIMYLNFLGVGGPAMYTYWPVVLIGVSAMLLFFPPPFFYWHSRRWFLESMTRLAFAPLYPVEFRDFFLGDMFCSQTYAMGNIELFFCLYAQDWTHPQKCNSSHSRLFGFFQTLPGIWRALQCLRRFRDSRAIYPHLVNCGKYGFTVLSYMSLSLFRINRSYQNLSLFIAFSSINSFYCIFWDIFNDWSLGNGLAKYPFLRQRITYKWYWYYIASVVDIIIRCNWIFYVIFKDDIQHSAIVSFAISLSEVLRRGMWTLFRVENEHANNVINLRASRDSQLPYSINSPRAMVTIHHDGTQDERLEDSFMTQRPPGDEESVTQSQTQSPTLPSAPRTPLRRWQDAVAQSPVTQVLKRVGTTILSAHAQDYQKRKLPESAKEVADSDEDSQSSDDEDVSRRTERNRKREEAAAEEQEDDAEEQFREQARWGLQLTAANEP